MIFMLRRRIRIYHSCEILGTADNTTRPYLKFSLNTKEALSKYKESIAYQLQSGYMKVVYYL